MNWTTDQISLLIEGYSKYRPLYVVKDKDYHNKHKRNLCLQNIVDTLSVIRPETTVEDVQKKWTGLRNTYATERKKCLASQGTGTGEDEVSKHNLLIPLKDLFIMQLLPVTYRSTNHPYGILTRWSF